MTTRYLQPNPPSEQHPNPRLAIMSNLRQKKREIVRDDDIEAVVSPNDDGAPGPATSSKPVTAERLQHNPFFIARLVLRKVCELITSDEDEKDFTIIGLLKDILIGIVFGLISVSTLVFLDHKGVIHMQSAHGYRDMARAMMLDPETRKNVEESSGIIFLDDYEYKTKFDEIGVYPSQVKALEERTKKYLADLEVAKKEHAAIKPGYDILVNDPMSGLDKFCRDCSWNGGTNCFMRLSYLMDKYNLKPIKAKLDLMKSAPQCVKNV